VLTGFTLIRFDYSSIS